MSPPFLPRQPRPQPLVLPLLEQLPLKLLLLPRPLLN
jgi:hypothetical protein